MPKLNLSRLASKVINTPLMILPDKLDVILGVIGERIGVEDVELATFGYEATERKEEHIPKTISVVKVHGSLVNRTHGLNAMSGLQSYDDIRNEFRAALAANTDAILLDIDSPGGEASGVMDLSDEIYEARGEKPIYASANESAFSAAYAIASAADKIFLSRTGHVGSIGVIAVHRDQSEADAKAGMKYTTIYKGDRKTDLSPHGPLSDEAKMMLEEEVADHYELFTKTVARNRGLKVAEVIATQAGMFMGEKAIQRGLADEVVSFSEVPGRILEDLTANSNKEDVEMSTKQVDTKSEEKEVKIMNAAELREKYPDLVAQIEGSITDRMSAEISEREAVMAEKEAETTEKIRRLEKAEAIRQEKDILADAGSIWTKTLANSDVPERLHDKVKTMVSHEKFVMDGVLDKAGFSDAVKAEVEDWEKRGATSSVMGTGFASRDVEDDEAKKMKADAEADDALVDRIFAASGGTRKGVK